MPLVEQPGAHAGTAQGMHAGQIDAALLELLEYLGRIIVAEDADQSRARLPHCRAKSAVQQRATWLPHARRAVGKHHVVDEQIAQQHDRRDHRSGLSSANAPARARTASRSSGLHQTPPCFTDEPTMNPWAVENRARFAGVMPDPTSTGTRTARTTSRTSSGEAGSPVAAPGHDDAVGEEELRGLGGLDDRDVRRDRVRAVLLLDVREHQHPFCADCAPVPEQLACTRLDHTFVRHVRVHESFDPDEVRTGRVRDGERLAIRCLRALECRARDRCRASLLARLPSWRR